MKPKKLTQAILCLAMSTSMAAVQTVPVLARPVVQQQTAQPENDEARVYYSSNVALNKPAEASSEEAATVSASNVTDGYRQTTEDGVKHHWGSNNGSGPDWVRVDLEQGYELAKIDVYWESQKANSYKIQVATENPDDESSWTSVRVSDTWPDSINESLVLETPVTARYIRVYIDSFDANDHGNNGIPEWNTISIYEIEAFTLAEPSNLALNRAASASSEETADFTADKAFDGDTTGKYSRWGSEVGNGPHWLMVDLGTDSDITSFNLTWETRKATDYSLQTAPAGADLNDEASWTTVVHETDRPESLAESFVLDSPAQGRYVRLWVESFDRVNPDDGVSWNTISVYELEVMGFQDEAPEVVQTLDGVLAAIDVKQPAAGENQLQVTLPEAEGFTVEYNGTDLEQVIDENLMIHTPVVDKTVKVSFKATDAQGKYKFREVDVTVPGQYAQEAEDNEAPLVLPELQEWKGLSGEFVLQATSRVLYEEEDFADAARALADDYAEISGGSLQVVQASADQAAAGDIVLRKTADKGLGTEGYTAEIGTTIVVEAENATGAYWSTRTLLQALKADEGNDSIACGILRDYPLYKTRSFMLDVGRKPFSMDFLKQLAKQMSWYKMNDLQLHLSDNYIWVEEYATMEDAYNAYSGFRLESDIREGGNNGLNKADLTSKDMYYTKDEFRAFIQDSRSIGINVVPEFDVPAHSLAYTKVRPDLAMAKGTINRPWDHFDLAGKFNECVEFIESVFSEYMEGENPVFDELTTVHIGSDEYEASQPAYRKFVNHMLDFVQSTGRKARLWGSLSQLKNGEEVLGNGAEVNLWNSGWAAMDLMYDLGFDLININDGQFYIVPNATYYYDYLNENTVYNAAINSYGGKSVPAGDRQMIGGAFAVWNDMSGKKENGMSEYDVFQRINSALPLFSANVWGKGDATLAQAKSIASVQGNSPDTNFGYEAEKKDGIIAHLNLKDLSDASGNGHTAGGLNNAQAKSVHGLDVLQLNGGDSHATVEGLETAGLDNSLRVQVKRLDASSDEQILFESPYGSIKAVQKGTGKVGITRENHDYSFNYTLPVGVWTELEIRNEFELVHLYVNGELVDTLGTHTRGQTKATCMLPVGTIGSSTSAFSGYVSSVRLGDPADFSRTIELTRAVEAGAAVAESQSVAGLNDAVAQGQALLSQWNPAQADVDAAAAAIYAILEEADVETADYTMVDFYLNRIPEDLSYFTPESAAVLKAAQESVTRSLPASMQEDVDRMASSLRDALSGLAIGTISDGTQVPQSEMTATASSSETSNEDNRPSNAIDGNPDTIWHTDWNDNTPPHWLNLDLKETRTITGLHYVPRQSGSNGRPTAYEVQISQDGKEYTTVKTGSMANTAAAKDIVLDAPVSARHVRFVITAGVGGFGSAAEITVSQQAPEADAEGLQALIAQAEALSAEAYSSESWQALQTALQQAKDTAAAEASYVETEQAKAGLMLAMARLQSPEAVPGQAEKFLLNQAVEYARQIKEDGGLEGVNAIVVSVFEKALASAEAVLADPAATQAEVNAAWTDLCDAIHLLDFKTDFTRLDALIARAEALNEADWTPESFATLQSALENAREVRNRPESLTEVSIQAACEALQSALDGLVRKDSQQVDVSLLRMMVSVTSDVDLDAYVPAGQDAFKAALERAQALLAAYDAGETVEQSDVDAAADELNVTWLALRLRPDESMLEALRGFVQQVQALDFSLYTEATANTIRAAAEQIQANLNNPDYTSKQAQEDLNLAAKIQVLIDSPDAPKTEPTVTPDNNEPSVKPGGSLNTDTPSGNEAARKPAAESKAPAGTQKSVKTAASSGLLQAAGALLASAGFLSALRRRRKK